MLIGEASLPTDQWIASPWSAATVAAFIDKNGTALDLDGGPHWVLGDGGRPQQLAQARLAAMLLMTLRGTPTIYDGDDLGTRDLEGNLLLLRQLEPALTVGDYHQLQIDGELLAYERRHEHQKFVIALNFGATALPLHLRTHGAVAASTNPNRPIGEHDIEDSRPLATTLQPFEGLLIRVA